MRLRPLLLYVAGLKFRVPEPDCEELLHDVLLSFMSADAHVENPRAWLVAAMCNASRAYWRSRNRIAAVETAPLDEVADRADAFDADTLNRELLVRAILQRLSAQDRLVLRLHYFERLTVCEIGTRLGTTPGYATKLVSKALRRARAKYRSAAATLPRQARALVPVTPPAETSRRPFAAFRAADMPNADASAKSAAPLDLEPE